MSPRNCAAACSAEIVPEDGVYVTRARAMGADHDAVTNVGSRPTFQGARFAIENEMWLASGERSAVVRSSGGWLDLRARQLVLPPPELMAVMPRMPRAEGFVELPPRRRT